MPPKFKYTKEEIIKTALDLVRENGSDSLTARGLGEKMGTSAKPIFVQFENMEELQRGVLNYANKLYQSYIDNSIESGLYPPYKASGIGYIKFAKQEKELFKLLFMRDRSSEKIGENREEIRPILDIIMQNLGLDEDMAYMFHLENWVYVHGLATMIATSYIDWDTEFIDKTLTDIYIGLKYRYTGK